MDNIFTNFLDTLYNFLINSLYSIIDLLFGWIYIPKFPINLENNIDSFLNLIFDNLSFLGFFVRPATIEIVVPLIIALVSFKYIYKIVMFIIRKIPFINIK